MCDLDHRKQVSRNTWCDDAIYLGLMQDAGCSMSGKIDCILLSNSLTVECPLFIWQISTDPTCSINYIVQCLRHQRYNMPNHTYKRSRTLPTGLTPIQPNKVNGVCLYVIKYNSTGYALINC